MALSIEEMTSRLQKYTDVKDKYELFDAQASMAELVLSECEIKFTESSRFFIKINADGVAQNMRVARRNRLKHLIADEGLAQGEEVLAYTGNYDAGHTCPGWESVLTLGIFGLKKKVGEYKEKYKTSESLPFYEAMERDYDAALRFMERVRIAALAEGKTEIAESLAALQTREPRTLFEAMQTQLIYYALQHHTEHTALRTFGRLDALLYPFYIKETEENARQLVIDYLKELNSIAPVANLPFSIGGTRADGSSCVNELSYLLLDAYASLDLHDTKMHILTSKNTPDDLLKNAFRAIRDGKNSIVFLCDEQVIAGLENRGALHSDAVNYHVVGCYECGADGELTCSCNARVNILKALEYALTDGVDFNTGAQVGLPCSSTYESFDTLLDEFFRQLDHLCHSAMKVTDIWESHYDLIHASPFMSSTYESSIATGRELYTERGAKYNSSSLNAVGLASATDSLYAIKRLVFDDAELTLAELIEILKNNWAGAESTRLKVKNKYAKYGTANVELDAIAKKIVDRLYDTVGGAPNVKGGSYRLGLFSIDWRWELGKKTLASADGRFTGETLSQNSSASFGADVHGATAHLISAARAIDGYKVPNGSIVDIDLHHSATEGEDGISALVSTLRTYFGMGGFGVHYNVLNSDVLRAAKKSPEDYPNLQVRLCGWNVLFANLSEKEKDEFIRRADRA